MDSKGRKGEGQSRRGDKNTILQLGEAVGSAETEKNMAVDGPSLTWSRRRTLGRCMKKETNNNNPKHNLLRTRTLFPLFYSLFLCTVQVPFTRVSIWAANGMKENVCYSIFFFSFYWWSCYWDWQSYQWWYPRSYRHQNQRQYDQRRCLNGVDLLLSWPSIFLRSKGESEIVFEAFRSMNHLICLNTLFIFPHLHLSLLQCNMVRETQSVAVSWFPVMARINPYHQSSSTKPILFWTRRDH